MSTKLNLPLAIATALAVMAGASNIAHASPISTTTDEARALAGRLSTPPSTDLVAASCRTVSSTDEARALAGANLPASSSLLLEQVAQTSTDEARVFAQAAFLARIAETAPALALAPPPAAGHGCATSSQ
jgi:hypothetical protein